MFSTLSEIDEYTPQQQVETQVNYQAIPEDPTPAEAAMKQRSVSDDKIKGAKGKFKKTPDTTIKIATSYLQAKQIDSPQQQRAQHLGVQQPLQQEVPQREKYSCLKPCHNIKQNANGTFTKCTYKGCAYAHYLEELRIPPCHFDRKCRNEECRFLHTGESVLSLYKWLHRGLPAIPSRFTELVESGCSEDEASETSFEMKKSSETKKSETKRTPTPASTEDPSLDAEQTPRLTVKQAFVKSVWEKRKEEASKTQKKEVASEAKKQVLVVPPNRLLDTLQQLKDSGMLSYVEIRIA